MSCELERSKQEEDPLHFKAESVFVFTFCHVSGFSEFDEN
jgi:hypothetical protein